MIYYQVAILNSPLPPLTYKSNCFLEIGSKVEITLQKRAVFGVVLGETKEPDFKCEEILTCKDEYYSLKFLNLAKFISNYYVCSLGDALSLFQPYSKEKEAFVHDSKSISVDITLSTSQKEALSFLEERKASLLFGDTGSGKSEIYMKLFEQMIKQNKSSIFLLPEIGLTPQMKKRLKACFGDLVAIWHSRITKKSKDKILKDIRDGVVKIVAGTRSALFLPVQNLGLIVVDEEHDESYKSNQRPRYNARDLALFYGKSTGVKVVLGSATPSINSFYKLPYFRLRGTFYGTKNRVIYEDISEEISPLLLNLIGATLERKKQAVIFLPTRANFKYLTCKECGIKIECPYCSVGMSLHLDKNALVCHYCNFTQAIPKECPECKCSEIISTRIGTQEVVNLLSGYFSQAVVRKFDKDEIKTQKILNKTLKDFNDKKIDILVGTQMLSKGHDYHGVSLAVVLGIDSILSMSDFRSREKSLSLVRQIAGRSGRSEDGVVYIGSKNWEFFKVYMDDYEKFLKDELEYRKELYPPFKSLLRILSSSKSDKTAREKMEKIADMAKNFDNVEVVGYGKSGIKKIANRYRYELLARSESKKALLRFAHKAKEFQVEIDMDPLSFS